MPLRGFARANAGLPYTTIIQLLSVPWSDYVNTRGFASREAQTTYMDAHVVSTQGTCKYQPMEDVISYDGYRDDIYETVNYVRWRNPKSTGGFTNWRYAFITGMEAKSANTTWISFHVDAIQTFMFDWTIRQSYIERQFTQQRSNGTVVPQTVPESVYAGNTYQIVHEETMFDVDSVSDMLYVIASRYSLEEDAGTVEDPKLISVSTQNVDGVPQCMGYYVCGGSYDSLNTVVEKLKDKPWVTAGFQNIWMIQNTILSPSQITEVESPMGFSVGKINGLLGGLMTSISNFRAHFDTTSFGPFKNTKMYCYPYAYIEMCTFTGDTFIIRPELIDGDLLSISAVTHIGGELRTAFVVNNYGGGNVDEGYNCGIQFASYPQLPIQVDSYNLAMAQTVNARTAAINNLRWSTNLNVINNALGSSQSFIGSVISGATSGAALGGGLGALIGGIGSGIFSALGGLANEEQLFANMDMQIDVIQAQAEDAKLRQDTVAGQWGGAEFMYAKAVNGVTLRWKCLTDEYLPKVSHYFDLLGYKVNTVGVPNINQNPYYNYVKLAVANITGDIPEEEMSEIKKAFESGITFWHTDDMYNYAVNNTI